jgi:hypothetical protein
VLVACADVGSTFTKVTVVETADGGLAGRASHPTTAGTDVLRGLDAAVAAAGGTGCPLLVCSSAGGGLRLAVVGYEELVSARAAQKVALTAGAQVVHVAAGPLDRAGVAALRAARPDVVLLVGGTDGGDAAVLLHNGARLAGSRLRIPVVLAGNADVREEVAALLAGAGVPVAPTGNVLPRIGVLDPEPARTAIREVFLRHVIGGKRLSRGPRFGRLVRGATPDLVLTGVRLLADLVDGDLVVVDIGGATTDVYSVRSPHPSGTRHAAVPTPVPAETGLSPATAVSPGTGAPAGTSAPAAEVTGVLWGSRTVEGDLGMRHSAPGLVAAAVAERLLDPADPLSAAAATLHAAPDRVAAQPPDWAVDERLATLAATVALRRHARSGLDLRRVRLVVGSGGVLRYGPAGLAGRVLAAALGDHGGGWALPVGPLFSVDAQYVLAAAGLLAAEYPTAASALLRNRLLRV